VISGASQGFRKEHAFLQKKGNFKKKKCVKKCGQEYLSMKYMKLTGQFLKRDMLMQWWHGSKLAPE
jgi:hypothetical protein